MILFNMFFPILQVKKDTIGILINNLQKNQIEIPKKLKKNQQQKNNNHLQIIPLMNR